MGEHKNPYPGENNTGHFWDDENDLRELSNRPPRWYMWAMYVSVISVIVYALYYPTVPWFGDHNKGTANWTAINEMNDSVKQLEDYREHKFADQEKAIAESTLDDIVHDEELRNYALKTAKVLFGDNCAGCHGAGGQGNDGFPVLADDDWLFGGTLADISNSITNGRRGNMPARFLGITDAEAGTLADYLMEVSRGETGSAQGKAIYLSKGCVGCHGPQMKGKTFMGSANLTDGIFRFKADDQKASLVRTILHGVNQAQDPNTQDAVMPGFGNSQVIDANQIKKLTVYVHQLGGGVAPKPKAAPIPEGLKPVEVDGTGFGAVLKAAETNYKKALDASMAWRDTGKMIKEAKKLNKAGKTDVATALAKKANTQAVNALKQAQKAPTAGPRF